VILLARLLADELHAVVGNFHTGLSQYLDQCIDVCGKAAGWLAAARNRAPSPARRSQLARKAANAASDFV
jgi:hypothetical protein